MFTSWSDMSTPPELSTASVFSRTPFVQNSIRPRCVSPRLPPSATTRALTSLAFTRTRSFARSPTSASSSPVAFT